MDLQGIAKREKTMTSKPFTLPTHAATLLAEASAHDGTPPLSDQAMLALAAGRRTWFDFGEAIGVLGEGELDLVVHPAARGRGLGRQALDTMLSSAPAAPLRAWVHGDKPAAAALLQRAGFTPVRSLLRMILDPSRLSEAIADTPPLPGSVRLETFDPSHPSHAKDWVRVNSRAFAAHPEQGAVTLDDFRTLTQEPWFDAHDLFLAYEDTPESPLAGFTWVKTTRDELQTETELYVIGVDPSFAGRGLGAALLGVTLRRMAEHHPDRITLYVDGDNAAARSLYQRVGFTVEQESTQWERTPPPNPSADEDLS